MIELSVLIQIKFNRVFLASNQLPQKCEASTLPKPVIVDVVLMIIIPHTQTLELLKNLQTIPWPNWKGMRGIKTVFRTTLTLPVPDNACPPALRLFPTT